MTLSTPFPTSPSPRLRIPSPPVATQPTRSPAGLASFVLGLAVALFSACFGPPSAELKESYEQKPGGPSFDHSRFDRLLAAHVDADGWVDYEALAADSGDLDAYLEELAAADFESLGRDEKMALLINAYNAFTLRLILDHYPVASIRDIPANERWDGRTWNLGGNRWTLNQIEHEQIRPKFKEPRIHFAVNCASVGCPPLARDAYTAARLDRQLDEQMRYTHSHDRWLRLEPGAGAVHLTKLYDWYGGDFEQVAESPLAFAARYSPPLATALGEGRRPEVRWLDYDWRLNSLANRP